MATKKTEKSVVIEIPEINLKPLTVKIVGTSPLLVHAFSEKAKKELLNPQIGNKVKKKEWRSPARDFVEAAYWYNLIPKFDFESIKDLQFEQREQEIIRQFNEYVANGATFGFPSKGLKKAMASGGYRAKVTKDKVSFFGTLYIWGELVEIQAECPEMREDAVRLSNGSADLRYRPIFKEWSATVNMTYNADVITPVQIINLMNIAGFSVGLCEDRVEKGGQFGMFRVATS